MVVDSSPTPEKFYDPVPTDKSCGDIKINGAPMPCAAVNRSLNYLKKCRNFFPNQKFIVVNDFSRPYGSYGSWVIPIAWKNGSPVIGKGIMRHPVSNGKANDGLFCSKNGNNQTPAGFHLSNMEHHSTDKKFLWPDGKCKSLPGISDCNESPKIGMVGIEPGLNAFRGGRNSDSSLTRGILMHGGGYAGSQGASNGCSVVSFDAISDIWGKIGGKNGGALIYNYPGERLGSKACSSDATAAKNFDSNREKNLDQSCDAISQAVATQGRTGGLMAQARFAATQRNVASTVPPETSGVRTSALSKNKNKSEQ